MKRDDRSPEDEDPGPEPSSPMSDAVWRETTSPDEPQSYHAQGPESDEQAGVVPASRRDRSRAPRASASDTKDSFTPSEEWLDAFNRQYSRAVYEAVCRYAARRLSGARKVSAKDDAARELAQAAVYDTLSGRAPWDHKGPKLPLHLRAVVWRQTSADWERARRLPHVSIDAVTPDGRSPVRDELEQAMREQRHDERAAEHARNRIAELRVLAAGDDDVIALIDAISDDSTSRADVMAVTGFSAQRYRAAARRLNQFVQQLPSELRLEKKGDKP